MPVDVAGLPESELLELVLVARDHAWEVHHLSEADHPTPTEEALEVSSGQRSAR